jgi:outer membrane protein assembly factor BamB
MAARPRMRHHVSVINRDRWARKSERPRRRRSRLLRVAVLVSALVALTSTLSLAHSHRPAPAPSLSPLTAPSLGLSWADPKSAGPLSLAVANGILYVSSADSLSAYPASCTPTVGLCLKLWSDPVPDGPLSAPVVSNGIVYASSAAGFVYAFPARCHAPACQPLWIGQTGPRAASAPSVNTDFVYVASDKLYAFPAECGSADELCPPAWTAELPGPATDDPPALGGGLVMVASRDQSGGVYAFPAVCPDRCPPTWTGRTGGPTTGVVVSRNTAFAVSRGQVFAFPLGCRDICRPAWTGPFIQGGPFAAGAAGRPSVGAGRLYVGASDGHLWIFPLMCAANWCPPLGSVPLGGDPLSTPVVADGLVFLVSKGGLVTAIPDGCPPNTTSCSRPWSELLGSGAGSLPAVTSTDVFIGDDKGTLYAYGLPQPK